MNYSEVNLLDYLRSKTQVDLDTFDIDGKRKAPVGHTIGVLTNLLSGERAERLCGLHVQSGMFVASEYLYEMLTSASTSMNTTQS
jgi:hypothetical protein